VLEGHLTVSSPWTIKPDGYHVEGGTAEDVTVIFRPNEPKKFVGQITLAEAGGRTASVSVTGSAIARETPTPTPTATFTIAQVEKTPEASLLPSAISPTPAPMPSQHAAASADVDAPAPVAEDAPPNSTNFSIRVVARRATASQWELQWPIDQQHPDASYRVDERTLSLDKSGGLLTNWVGVPVKLSATPDHVVAQLETLETLETLDDGTLHMLRVTAVAPDGSTLWEAPLVALQPRSAQSHGHTFLLLSLGILLAVFLFFRWRA
jgi:hypothetical protein